MSSKVYTLTGLVWSSPGRCSFRRFGPFACTKVADAVTAYVQGDLICREHDVKDWFCDLVRETDAMGWRGGSDREFLLKELNNMK